MPLTAITSSWPDVIQRALNRPSGARFYRCALQVNPFAYLKRHGKATPHSSEDEYNNAVLEAFQDNGIEVIAVTDHYRVKTSQRLVEAARSRDLHVFSGFEAVTKEGVHVLCLFDPSEDLDRIDRFLGDCGIHDDSDLSPTGSKNFHELLEVCADTWNGVSLAAHVCSGGGLLSTLSGQAAIKAWNHKHLHACALPGPIDDAPQSKIAILRNRNPDYQRTRPIAVINAQDVNSPTDAGKPGSVYWIKMAGVSIEGLRQAFLDPDSRIRLSSDQEPEDHTELLAMAWEGGFLDGTTIRFNENLDVLIGGRGTGKSTIVESIRFALDCLPLGKEAAELHKAFVNNVLGSGTKISLLIRSHTPSSREYLVERTVGNRPTVKDSDGNLTELSPRDIASEVEIYGQHEISELARSPERLTGLLDRFMNHAALKNIEAERLSAKYRLEDTRSKIVDIEQKLTRIDEDLAALPGLKETLRRYKEAGLEERLKDENELVTEESTLDTLDQLVTGVAEHRAGFNELLPLDVSRLDDEKLEKLCGADILREARLVIEEFEKDIQVALRSTDGAVENARNGLKTVRAKWDLRRDTVNTAHEKTLRDLQKEGIDGNEFIQLRQRIEQLEPKKDEQTKLQNRLQDAQKQRREGLKEWEELKASQFRELQRAARRVNSKLSGRVQVTVSATGDRSQLENHLRSLGGRIADTINALKEISPLSLQELSQACREGKDNLSQKFGIPSSQAEKLVLAGSGFVMQLEELELPATTTVSLNVAREGATPVWKQLDDLSTGQKATAVLLLLLLESSGPLVVDQPEDDLDNRFITEGVVPNIREEKRRRQFIFATHNANIPVLGDAELIAGLIPTESVEGVEVHLPDENLGSIDSRQVRELVEETLEGGKEAFEMRWLKYGY